MKRLFCILLLLALSLSACTEAGEDGSSGGSSGGSSSTAAGTASDIAKDASELFTDRDYNDDYAEDGSVHIPLNGDSAEADSDAVRISGTIVTVTEAATYVISGTLDDGMLVVDAPDTAKVQLVFDGVQITSRTSAALYVLEADKVFLTLAEGTENALSNGGEFVAVDDNNIDAALFSKQDLTLNGAGSLTVTSPAGHGVVCKDDLVITGGTYTVYAASHGIDANDSVRIADGLLTLDAGKDGIHAENNDDASLGYVYISGGTLRIEAEGDGVSAGSTMQLEGGSLDILAGGGSENGSKQSSDSWGGFMGGRPGMGTTENAASEDSTSMKGLKAGTGMLISAGDFTIDSADDAVHSNASITVNGGSFAIATGDDAFHADDTLTVTDGSIRITDSYEGLEALHVVVSGGDIELYASDDGINAAGGTDSSGTGGRGGDRFGGPGMNGGMSSSSSGTIVISGGSIRIEAHGDGIDANGTLTVSGGYVAVWGPTQGDTATLDYDVSGVITGGTFIGTGASGMAQTFSSSEQGVIAVSVGSQSAGTTVTVTDEDGNVLLSYEPPLSFSVVIYSSPELVTGQSYTISVGSASGTFTAS